MVVEISLEIGIKSVMNRMILALDTCMAKLAGFNIMINDYIVNNFFEH